MKHMHGENYQNIFITFEGHWRNFNIPKHEHFFLWTPTIMISIKVYKTLSQIFGSMNICYIFVAFSNSFTLFFFTQSLVDFQIQ